MSKIINFIKHPGTIGTLATLGLIGGVHQGSKYIKNTLIPEYTNLASKEIEKNIPKYTSLATNELKKQIPGITDQIYNEAIKKLPGAGEGVISKYGIPLSALALGYMLARLSSKD